MDNNKTTENQIEETETDTTEFEIDDDFIRLLEGDDDDEETEPITPEQEVIARLALDQFHTDRKREAREIRAARKA